MKKIFLSINYRILFLCGIVVLITKPLLAQDGDSSGFLSDTNIHYIGRWDKTNPKQYNSYWACAYIRVDFTGKSIGINLANATNLAVSIDGEIPRAVKASSGITQLNLSPLAEGTHTLLVAGAGQNEELSFLGLILENGAQTLLSKDRLLIEFIGDSNTAGTGPAGTAGVNYAWNTAESLDCDHTQIAFSGLALSSGYGCAKNKIGMDSLYFNLKNYNHIEEIPVVPWNFVYTPDIVVVNLGTNDKCGNASDAVIKRNMSSFFNRLREKYPSAHLVAMRPYNGSYAGPISTVVEQMNDKGDRNVYYVNTEDWLMLPDDYTDGIHTNEQGELKVRTKLIEFLKPIIKNITKDENPKLYPNINVFPNPFDDKLTITSHYGISKAILYDLYGRKVNTFSTSDINLTLNTKHIVSGSYLLSLLLDNGCSSNHKLIKFN